MCVCVLGRRNTYLWGKGKKKRCMSSSSVHGPLVAVQACATACVVVANAVLMRHMLRTPDAAVPTLVVACHTLGSTGWLVYAAGTGHTFLLASSCTNLALHALCLVGRAARRRVDHRDGRHADRRLPALGDSTDSLPSL